MIKERKYIHNYESQYASCKKRLNSLKISKRNKELISKFENDCFLKDGIEIPTRLKYYDVLINVALKYVKKDFDKLTKEDY
ncbi:hypothetical protein CL618_00460, partial [archaeon]|nr:hypothetical protein [archaeon]